MIPGYHIFAGPQVSWCCLPMTLALAEQTFNHGPRLQSGGAMTVSKMNLIHILKRIKTVPKETLSSDDEI